MLPVVVELVTSTEVVVVVVNDPIRGPCELERDSVVLESPVVAGSREVAGEEFPPVPVIG